MCVSIAFLTESQPNSRMSKFSQVNLPIGVERIKQIIPHRFPFLLLDRITEIGEDSIKGLKNVTANEAFFQGHFPEVFIMPGVLIVEAIAQLACVHQLLIEESNTNTKIGVFAGIDQARFKTPVFPGDKLDLEASIMWSRRGVGRCKGQASVDGKIAFSGELAFALIEQKSLNAL